MMRQGLSYFTDIQLTSAGLIIFFTIFAGVLFWTFRRSGRAHYSKMEMLPLTEAQTLNKGAVHEQ